MEDWPHPASLPITELSRDCQFQRTRRSGPGGQHRNKVESAIVVTHLPTGISGQASERRSQHENRTVAIERLRLNLAISYRSPEPVPGGPSNRWSRRCSGKSLSIRRSHNDFAALIAEALDVIWDCQGQLSTAASRLGCSTSQLIKLLKMDASVVAKVNQQRQQWRLGRLK